MHSIRFIYHNIQWFNGVHNQPISKNWTIWKWTFVFLASFAFHGWSSISLDCQMFIIHMILGDIFGMLVCSPGCLFPYLFFHFLLDYSFVSCIHQNTSLSILGFALSDWSMSAKRSRLRVILAFALFTTDFRWEKVSKERKRD